MVDVHLGKSEVTARSVLVRQLGENGRDGATGWTPVRVEVDDDMSGRGHQGIECGDVGYFMDVARGFGNGRTVRKESLEVRC